jgi:hypothetical protein
MTPISPATNVVESRAENHVKGLDVSCLVSRQPQTPGHAPLILVRFSCFAIPGAPESARESISTQLHSPLSETSPVTDFRDGNSAAGASGLPVISIWGPVVSGDTTGSMLRSLPVSLFRPSYIALSQRQALLPMTRLF